MELLKEIINHKVRKLKTLVLCLQFVGFGINAAITGVTLLDLGVQTNTTVSEVAKMLPARACGYTIGALISGFVADHIDHQISLMLSLAIAIATKAATPFSQSIVALYAISSVFGASCGCINTVGNVYIIYLWGEKAAPFIHAIHFAFGFGSFISSMIANPFLLEVPEASEEFGNEVKNFTSFSNFTTNSLTNLTPELTTDDLRIHWPYIITSVFNLCVLIFFIIVYCFRPVTEEYPRDSTTFSNRSYSPNESTQPHELTKLNDSAAQKKIEKETSINSNSFIKNRKSMEFMKSEKLTRNPSEPFDEFTLTEPLGPCIEVFVIALSLLFFHFYAGLEVTFGSLLSPFAVKSNLKMSKSESSFLTSTFWGIFTFFRIVSIYAVTYFSPRALMIFNTSLIMLSNMLMLPLANDYRWALWVGASLMGFGCSSVFPTMISFVQQLIRITPRFAAFSLISSSLGQFSVPLIIGIWIDTNPEVYLYVIFGYSFLSVAVLLIIFLIQHHVLKKQRAK